MPSGTQACGLRISTAHRLTQSIIGKFVTSYIEINNGAVGQLLQQLADRAGETEPFLRALGEDMVERIKGRFGSGTGPDGTPWALNGPVTLARYIQSRGSRSKKRPSAPPVKRPLIASGEMSRGIHYQVNGDALLVASPAPQAFMMQFGGTKAEFPHLWGDIPARPFFPVQPDGSLYQGEEDAIVEALTHYLTIE
jgi:phage gpG-like protein